MKDRQIEELRASRKRLVQAAAADRCSIERELHDGVQQRLSALAVELQQARRLVDVHPAAAGALIDEMAGEVAEALDALRPWRTESILPYSKRAGSALHCAPRRRCSACRRAWRCRRE